MECLLGIVLQEVYVHFHCYVRFYFCEIDTITLTLQMRELRHRVVVLGSCTIFFTFFTWPPSLVVRRSNPSTGVHPLLAAQDIALEILCFSLLHHQFFPFHWINPVGKHIMSLLLIRENKRVKQTNKQDRLIISLHFQPVLDFFPCP